MLIKNTIMRITLLFLLCLPFLANSQQLADRSNFYETGFIWNPAMTASAEYWEMALVHREQWTGFGQTPRTTTISAQYPFIDQNMSLGGYFMYDEIKPLVNTTVGLSYAYKLFLGRGKTNQLAFGVSGSLTQSDIQNQDFIVNEEDDEFIPRARGARLNPNVAFGALYSFNPRGDRDRLYYIGAGVNQILPIDVIFDDSGGLANIQRTYHGSGVAGARLIRDEFVLEPSIWVNFSDGGVFNSVFGLKLEGSESFVAGFSYSTNNTIAFQVGGIIINALKTYGDLRFGVLAAYNVGTFGQFRDLGYEFYLGYRYQL